jgi:F-type H+-transporting ATPase subunit b
MSVAHTPAGTSDIVALTGADGTHGHGPELLGLNAEGWVYVGLTIFILLAIFVGKAPKKITDALDARIAETVRELDEARALRAEAERLLAQARAQQAASATDAAAIIAHAEAEARDLVADAERDAGLLIERRTRMAQDKIGAAERSAVTEVRTRAAVAAARAAEMLIREGHDAGADRRMVDTTISGLGRA